MDQKLLMLGWIKFRPLFLKMFHSFEHSIVTCRTKHGFKLISPERNNNKWENEQVSMNLYLLQLLIASWRPGVLMCLCKNAADKQIKMKKSYVTTFTEQGFQK